MYKKSIFNIEEIPDLNNKLIEFAKLFELACILDSHTQLFDNNDKFKLKEYDLVAGFAKTLTGTKYINDFEDLDQLLGSHNNWFLGYLTYDLKNRIEDLQSNHTDNVNWPEVFFFIPDILLLKKDSKITLLLNNVVFKNFDLAAEFNKIVVKNIEPVKIHFTPRINKNEYLEKIGFIQNHIARGDIYEVNFCQEFYSNSEMDPYAAYQFFSLNIPSPFGVFLKIQNKFLLSASPERFLKKKELSVISQPIKGTSNRSNDPKIDLENKKFLKESSKEQSENIMIVDLVRNDLSRIAEKGSVKVKELCGLYSFPQVHQMISTISARLNTNSFKDIIKATFPMGSMTGAPKIEAMKIIEKFESTKRGLYSGSIGYITPAGDFDLNVVIRSLQYNSENHYVSYIAGSAITALSDPEMEYQECILKTYGINQALNLKNHAE
jgi:para-aminobenzoate synthetase component I